MLAKRPWDNIEQILIVISFKWLLARWWMGANLPLCRALERLFNMTIKCLSFRFYCIFLSLSCKLLCPPSSSSFFFFSYLPPTPLLLSLSLHITSSVQCSFLRRLNWDSAFLHLGALTYVLWHALSQFYVVIDFSSPLLFVLPSCLNRHKPFCFLLSDSSHSCLGVTLSVRQRKTSLIGDGGVVEA